MNSHETGAATTREILPTDAARLFERAHSVVLYLASSHPAAIATGLAMLQLSLVDSLTLRAPSQPWVVKLRRSAAPRVVLVSLLRTQFLPATRRRATEHHPIHRN